MFRLLDFVDRFSACVGKAFAWCILVLTFATSYEVFVRYVLRDPTAWAFDMSYIMYGALFMMAGAYTLSRNGRATWTRPIPATLIVSARPSQQRRAGTWI